MCRHRTIEEVPLAEQGEMLTRAALEFCLADAFHPGCEMTWPVRTWTMYMQPFRFTPGAAGLGAAQSRRGADLGQRHHPQRAALRAGAGRHHPLDGGALADRHGELPLRL